MGNKLLERCLEVCDELNSELFEIEEDDVQSLFVVEVANDIICINFGAITLYYTEDFYDYTVDKYYEDKGYEILRNGNEKPEDPEGLYIEDWTDEYYDTAYSKDFIKKAVAFEFEKHLNIWTRMIPKMSKDLQNVSFKHSKDGERKIVLNSSEGSWKVYA